VKRYYLPLLITSLLFLPVASPSTERLSSSPPGLAGCSVFPADNIWNTPVDHLPVHASSQAYIQNMGLQGRLHPDFGAGLWDGGPIGIPYNIVSGNQNSYSVTFDYEDESDQSLYPIPLDPLIEGGPDSDGDRHILILDRDHCILYELFYARFENGGWTAGSGAIFPLYTNTLRPDTWTSADAAGLPILPGLARYEEAASGEIAHALRFTSRQTNGYTWPARHKASTGAGPGVPPLGLRLRLKASFEISSFSPEVRTILKALQTYGMMLADNGSNWYISGAPDERWDNDVLVSELARVRGSDFEVVDVSSLIVDPNSGKVRHNVWTDFLHIPLIWNSEG
jgi:hypothetical protein